MWLDPDLPSTFAVVEEVLAGVANLFPSPYVHIGGDEPLAMPHHLYASYVPRVREFVRSIGKRLLGWQESARAGLGAEDIIQYWFTDIALTASLPVAGVEAAIWAETISDFDDLAFLLFPRLPGIAHKAWSDPHSGSWTDHRDRLSRHGHLWEQDNLTYFRTSTVDRL